MDENEDQKESEDYICPGCGARQYGDMCPTCGIEILKDDEKEKTKDDDDEYDRKERR